ncbi:MAG: hypothetical protein MK135_07120, partial [Polyangiaceae bacterium]|nr:hypothetical protein [Polyangiaceae bacterium]
IRRETQLNWLTMIDAVTNITNATASAASSTGATGATGAEQELGRDEFLKLLVAQLQNQDPLKPQDNAEFVAELAQFSNLEQTIGINDRLDALSAQNQGLQNSQVVSMVGQTATVRGAMVTADGSGQPTTIPFSLDGAAETVSVSISNLAGTKVKTIELGARPQGATSITWQGTNENGEVMPAGTYTVSVNARTGDGSAVSVEQETSGKVLAVSFEKGYPVLQLDSGAAVPISDLLRVEE